MWHFQNTLTSLNILRRGRGWGPWNRRSLTIKSSIFFELTTDSFQVMSLTENSSEVSENESLQFSSRLLFLFLFKGASNGTDGWRFQPPPFIDSWRCVDGWPSVFLLLCIQVLNRTRSSQRSSTPSLLWCPSLSPYWSSWWPWPSPSTVHR